MNYVSRLHLINDSATVCSLECYYKESPDSQNCKRVGSTGSFPVSQERELDLNNLGIPDGALVTAYASVDLGFDSHGNDWFVFKKDWEGVAFFRIKGTTIKSRVYFEDFKQIDDDIKIEDMTAYRVKDAIDSLNHLPGKGTYEKIKGLEYFANLGVEHIQGYTQYEKDGKLFYLFTHDTKGNYGYILQAESGSENTKCISTPFGWYHPAGIQCLGQYLFVPCEVDSEAKIFVYDVLNNLKMVKVLKCSHRAGCIGVTDIKRGEDTYVVLLVGDQQKYYAYVAKKCTMMKDLNFEPFGKIDLGTNRTPAQDSFFDEETISCQGFGLVTDANEQVHMLALMTNNCVDKVYMLKINIDFSTKSVCYETEVSVHLVNAGGIVGDYGSHFRWGAGIRITPKNELVVLATSRNIIAGTKLDTTVWCKSNNS